MHKPFDLFGKYPQGKKKKDKKDGQISSPLKK